MGSTRRVAVKSPRVSQEGLEEWREELSWLPDDFLQFTNRVLLVNLRRAKPPAALKIQVLCMLSTPTVTEDRVNGADELAATGAQFADALLDYAFQDALTLGKKRNEHLATVFAAPRAADVAIFFQTIHELHRAVMADEQAVRERLDFGGGAIRHSANGKEHEVLLRLEADGSRGGIAFAEK